MDTTLRLDDSILDPARGDGGMAIRWFCEGSGSPYQAITEQRVVIGRGQDADVSLEAAGVSRCHAELYRQGPALVFHDLGSTNGTHVNGAPVEYASLLAGDVLRLGDAVGLVVRRPAPPPEPLPEGGRTAGAGTTVRSDADGDAELTELAPGLVFGAGMARELAELRRVGGADLPVVIVGETGSGKEYVARALHLLAGRAGPFHAVNCAALPAPLAEAELFGHSKGAFTGAAESGIGHVRAAHGGTLFLDELPELALPVQAKLLRVLQEREVIPLGDTRAVPVNLRIVAAGQRPFDDLVACGRMRQDLAARLTGLVLSVPPLRDRLIDVVTLFRYFLTNHLGGQPPRTDPRLIECLLLYHWPGNVRELELLARRLAALHGAEPMLRRSFLPPELRDGARAVGAITGARAAGEVARGAGEGGGAAAEPSERSADRDEHDLKLLVAELRRHGGNVSRAATAARISRARAYRLMAGRSAEQLMAQA